MGDLDVPLQFVESFRAFAQGMQDKNGPFPLQQLLAVTKGQMPNNSFFMISSYCSSISYQVKGNILLVSYFISVI